MLDSVEFSNIHNCTIFNSQQEGSKVFIQHKDENTLTNMHHIRVCACVCVCDVMPGYRVWLAACRDPESV